MRNAFGTGWIAGLFLAFLELLVALFSGGGHVPLDGALLTIGLYPLVLGFLGAVIYLILFRPASSIIRTIVLFTAFFPWLLVSIFPKITMNLLFMRANLPKVIGVFVFTLLLVREMKSWNRFWRIITPGSALLLALPILPLVAALMLRQPFVATDEAVARVHGGGDRPNIVLITIDTLRGDELGMKNTGSNSPTIDSLAQSGVYFENCQSNAPWTLASVSSFMTGLYPSSTGVFTGRQKLSNSAETLAEHLSLAGYHTHAILSNLWLRPQFGLAQGFDVYDHRRPDESRDPYHSFLIYRLLTRSRQTEHQEHAAPESATDLVNAAEKFLREASPEPFFLWIHFNDLHDPYEPPQTFLPQSARGVGAQRPTSGRIVNLRQGKRLSASERAHIRDLYRGELRYVDSEIRRLLYHLRAENLSERTLVILTADHGEEFWEHGSVGHGHTLYNELLQVPLLFSGPGMINGGVVRDDPVTLIDLLPTIVKWANPEAPLSLPGRMLLDKRTPKLRLRYAEALEFFEESKSVSGHYQKLILSEESGTVEFYEVDDDPMETMNIKTLYPDRVDSLKSLLGKHLKQCQTLRDSLDLSRDSNQLALNPELVRMLRAQGYLQ